MTSMGSNWFQLAHTIFKTKQKKNGKKLNHKNNNKIFFNRKSGRRSEMKTTYQDEISKWYWCLAKHIKMFFFLKNIILNLSNAYTKNQLIKTKCHKIHKSRFSILFFFSFKNDCRSFFCVWKDTYFISNAFSIGVCVFNLNKK